MSTNKMQAAIWHGPKDLRVEEVPVPDVVSGSVLLEVKACAVCGSDLRIFGEGNPRIEPGRIIGHEIAGEVVAVGAGVEKFRIGDRIAVGADVPCGKCVHCLSGRPNCCDVNLAIGYQFDGGFAQYVRLDPIVVELGPVAKLQAGTSYEAAALAEPLGCCVNGYERALMREGNSVAIFGGGPIGAMLAALGHALGASKVIMVEPSASRRTLLQQLGGATVVDPTSVDPVAAIMELTGGQGADTLFTACPVAQAHEQAIAAVAKRGVVNLFGGLPKTAPAIALSSNHLHYREAYITGSHGSTPEQHRYAVSLIEEGRVDARRLVGASMALGRIHDALDMARAGSTMKVVVAPNG